MNEQIKKFMEQAGTDISGKWMGIDNAEKFAELIVQDMLRLLTQYTRDSFPEDFIDDFDRGYLSGLHTAQKAVKKHFGIK